MLVLDLSRLGFCDSSGLNELLRARLNRHGVPLALAAPGSQVLRLFTVTATDRLFVITDSARAATNPRPGDSG